MIDSFSGPYHFLSNFYPCIVEYEGLKYCSSDAAYQAAKTVDMGLTEAFTKTDPATAKRAGSKIKLREDWDGLKLGIMKDILTIKFQDPELREMLINPGDEELIEGNTWGDRFYGVCRGRGRNHLGLLLMELRRVIVCAESL